MEVKKNARRIKRHFTSKLTTKAEATANQNNIKTLHDNINFFTRKHRKETRPIKIKQIRF